MSSFTSEINKLKNIQQHLEKHGNTFIDKFSKLNQNTELPEMQLEHTKNRQMQQEKLRRQMIDIRNPLKKISDSLNKKDLMKLDVSTVSSDMTGIQSNIKNLNDSSQHLLQELQVEEQVLLNDLQHFQQKIENWEKRNSTPPKYFKPTVSTPENISPEVKAFMDFVANTGGHENGWNSNDHTLFLRTRSRIKDSKKLAEIIHSMLPDISEKEVKDHEAWYIRYLDLKEKQKTSIKNWRTAKAEQKSPPSNKSSEKPCAKDNHTECLQKELVQEQLHAWKSEKLIQSKYQYEQKQQELTKRKEEEQAKKQKQEVIREQVTHWKESKKLAEEEEKLRKAEEKRREQREREVKANRLIKEFQNQDALFVQSKLQKLHSQNSLPSTSNLKNTEEKSRDRSRLLEPTQQWILRKYTGPSQDNHVNNMNIHAAPKLRTPEWRKFIT